MPPLDVAPPLSRALPLEAQTSVEYPPPAAVMVHSWLAFALDVEARFCVTAAPFVVDPPLSSAMPLVRETRAYWPLPRLLIRHCWFVFPSPRLDWETAWP